MSKVTRLTSATLKHGILLSFKESYLFTRNLFGLYKHPFKTIRAIFREEDISQFLLIFGLPLYIFIGGLGLIWISRRLINAPYEWGLMAKSLLLLLLLLTLLFLIYLGFWFYKVFKTKE